MLQLCKQRAHKNLNIKMHFSNEKPLMRFAKLLTLIDDLNWFR